ncbi:hypothetical protein JVT61DRAFT_471 [Boletus reticuloceps]|uniref:Zn(2)-C6 fungal-type domain-containing protein n=1 Tax=Boletus reticuloceps TaxID=495285 RepID=A0A8I2Z373_9AGAM|nr:hypothetical protein JVT61DRAFT_471 [Boletus reticuloceps]
MQSCQPGSNQNFDCNEPDDPTTIPAFARAWESAPQVASSVRRPSTLPDPQSYHEVTEPHVIFELDEKREDGSIETILVVPFGCKRCKTFARQACSRARPTCARCENVGENCKVLHGGYQRLPGPKISKSSAMPPMRRWSTSGTCNKSVVGSPTTQELTTGRLHPRRIASRVASVSQALPSRSGLSVSPGSKRPPSPGYDPVQPRKKAQTMTTSRKKEARRFKVAPPKEMDVDCSDVSAVNRSNQIVSGAVSADERGALNWRFVYGHEKSSRGRNTWILYHLIP